MISIKALATLVSFVAMTNGHMIMKTPIPYGKGTITNGPLDPSGSDFPCKNVFELANGDADINKMQIGSSQTLSFTGSAVHGGGSCQVSLTTDLKPTKDSKWMVIKSIEGSCPAGTDGNLPADPNGNGASQFQYTIPEGIAPGQYTIAWTWVNKIGNREFYMNCGRADISAAAKKRYAPAPKVSKRQSSFPGLFVANIPSVNSCTTTEGTDIVYPNPGNDPIKSTNSNVKFGPPNGSNCELGGGSADAPAPNGSSGSGATTTDSGSSTPTNAPGVFASGAASSSEAPPAATTTAAAAAATTSAAAAATTSAAAPAATSAAPTGESGSGSGSGSGSSGSTTSGPQSPGSACSPEGQWACSADGTSFQRCASGVWSAAISMSAGTKCTPGESADIQMQVVTKAKRVIFAA